MVQVYMSLGKTANHYGPNEEFTEYSWHQKASEKSYFES